MAVAIKVRTTNVGIQPSATSGVTLRNTFTAGKSRFDELLDVDTTLQANGGVPTYNASLDKYEIKPITDNIPSLDGGTF